MPFDVHSLTKLADAADPTVASIAVFSDDKGELFIWAMVDQELRYGDYVALDSSNDPGRPGLFQATITGVGTVCVYKDYKLLGNLEHNALIADFHDVLWTGPVHDLLKENLQATLDDNESLNSEIQVKDVTEIEHELLIRWQNAICRVLLNIQQYRHGGGLLIVPDCPAPDVNVKYPLLYDRLPTALLGLVQHQLLKKQTSSTIAQHCPNPSGDFLPCDYHFDAVKYQEKLDEYKNIALGCAKFLASLSRVDGFVLLDRSLVVHGFGVEMRADSELSEIFIAGDAEATPRLLRPVPISYFGTRHRATMRYCYERGGALGFIISQDSDIRATMKVGNRLILWQNINAQLAFKTENRCAPITNLTPMIGLFQFWAHSVTNLRSA
jgi:hypothetical protein